jgi:hypothetical protein
MRAHCRRNGMVGDFVYADGSIATSREPQETRTSRLAAAARYLTLLLLHRPFSST